MVANMKSIVALALTLIVAAQWVLGEDLWPFVEHQRRILHDLVDSYEVQQTKIDMLLEKARDEVKRLKQVEANATAEIKLAHQRLQEATAFVEDTRVGLAEYAELLTGLETEDWTCPTDDSECRSIDLEVADYQASVRAAARDHVKVYEAGKVELENIEKTIGIYHQVRRTAAQKRIRARSSIESLEAKRGLVEAKLASLQVQRSLAESAEGSGGEPVVQEAQEILEELEEDIDRERATLQALADIEARPTALADARASVGQRSVLEDIERVLEKTAQIKGTASAPESMSRGSE